MKPLISMFRMTAVPVLLLAAPAMVCADTVAGHFQHNEERAEFSHGIAVHWPDPDVPGARILFVLLADAEPDVERGRGKQNPIANIEAGLPWNSARLSLYLVEDGSGLAVHRISFSSGLVALSPGGDELRMEDGRIIGSYLVPEMALGSGHWQADIRFNLPLIDLAGGD